MKKIFITTIFLIFFNLKVKGLISLNEQSRIDNIDVGKEFNISSEKTTSEYLTFTSPISKKDIKFYHTFSTSTTNNKENSPLIFWTNGGPGVSSLSAWFQGISSNLIKEDSSLDENLYYWAKFADIVTTDQPLGSGFSYLTEGEEYRTTYDHVASEYCEFMKQFLIQKGYLEDSKIPKKILVVGESMSGHFVPEASNCLFEFLKSLKKGFEKKFKVALVSPWVLPLSHYSTFRQYAYNLKLITREEFNSPKLIESEKTCLDGIRSGIITQKVVNDCYQFTDDVVNYRWAFYDVRVKATHPPSEKKHVLTFSWTKTQKKIQEGGFNKLLGINPEEIDTSKFVRYNNQLVNMLAVESTTNKIDQIVKLVNPISHSMTPGNELQLLVMTGMYDMISNYLGARGWIYSMDYVKSQTTQFKSLRIPNAEQGKKGWIQSYRKNGRVFYSEVEDAGHMISSNQPQIIFGLIEAFVNDNL